MIEIRKGSRILKVSKCAYEDTFKKLGYQIVNNSKEEAKKASSNEIKKQIDNKEEEFIEVEKEKNKEIENKDEVSSDKLNVNVIGENIENFGIGKKEGKSVLEKALEQKSNKPKGK